MLQNIRLIFSGFLVLMFVLAFHPAAFSQKRKTTKQPKADLFDEFGAVGYCDLTARLDNFAIFLQDRPKVTGYILSYAPPDRGLPIAEQLKDYLVNSRGIDPDDLMTMYAGRNNVLSALRIQLWIVPDGALPPAPEKFDAKPESFKGMFYEHEGYDDIPYPGVSEEGEGFSLGVTLSAFIDVFRQQPKSDAYVVGYNGETSTPGAWRRIAEDEIEFLKRGGFESSRFKTIYGGNVKEAKVEVWIQPASDQPPVKDAGPESAPTTSIQMGDYGEADLGYTKYERTAFKRIADSLLGFPNLRACVIVRVGQPPEEIEETEERVDYPLQVMDDPPAEPEEPEPPPADLLQLVEKWKREFAEKHKILEDRFIVLFAKTLPGYSSSLETWLVPQAQSLPDPEELLKETEDTNQSAQSVTKALEPITMSVKPGKASGIGATTGKKP
jgi:hypothetical protein